MSLHCRLSVDIVVDTLYHATNVADKDKVEWLDSFAAYEFAKGAQNSIWFIRRSSLALSYWT